MLPTGLMHDITVHTQCIFTLLCLLVHEKKQYTYGTEASMNGCKSIKDSSISHVVCVTLHVIP